MFAMVDQFISPSNFLKEQYVKWGLDNRLISVVENLPIESLDSSPRSNPDFCTSKKECLNVSYFGQVNPWKGLDVIIRSFKIALDQGANLKLLIHGIDKENLNINSANDSFLQTCADLISTIDSCSIEIMGRYDSTEVASLMSNTDILVMGSIWYENSPMVIQEAYFYHIPVIAPNLGGMAEKVVDHESGLLYQSRNEYSLAQCMNLISSDRSLLEKLRIGTIRLATILDEQEKNHHSLYQSLIS